MSLRPGNVFEYGEDHASFRDPVQRIAAVAAESLERSRTEGIWQSGVLRELGKMGFLGTLAPETLGGGETDDLRFTMVLAETFATVGATELAHLLAVHSGLVVPLLAAHRDPDVRALVPGLVSGESLGVAVLGSTGRTDPDTELLVLRGVPGAAVADAIVVGDRQAGGVSVLRTGRPGVRVVPVATRSYRSGAVADVYVERSLLCSKQEGGSEFVRDLSLWLGFVATSCARTVLSRTVEYVAQRTVFGRPLAELEATRTSLGAIAANVLAAEHLCGAALSTRDPQLASAALLTALDAHAAATDRGLQLHGGYGYMREYPISSDYADAAHLRLCAGRAAAIAETLAVSAGL